MEWLTVALSLFLSEKHVKLLIEKLRVESPNGKMFLLGTVTLILTASVHMSMTSIGNRSQTIRNEIDETETVASVGFFADSSGRLRCFHCGCSTDFPIENPLARHRNSSPNCFLQRLLTLLTSDWSRDPPEVVGDSVKFSRALQKLQELLQNPLLTFVESFGFSRQDVEFSAARFFMTKNGDFPSRPGDLVERLQEETETMRNISGRLRLLELVRMAMDKTRVPLAPEGAARESAAAAEKADLDNAGRRNQNAKAAVKRGQHDRTDDSACEMCRQRQKDCLLLPCRHLRFCRKCVEQIVTCPVCGSAILGLAMVFLT